MDKTFILETPATSTDLFEIVSDLTTYPQWIDFVHKVEGAASDQSGGNQHSGDGDQRDGQAWWVTLRARLGPLARSKRLRMTRTECTPPGPDGLGLVRFERHELDGRDHADWILEVQVQPSTDSGSNAHCRLAYNGTLWTSPLEPLLDQGANESADRLAALVVAS